METSLFLNPKVTVTMEIPVQAPGMQRARIKHACFRLCYEPYLLNANANANGPYRLNTFFRVHSHP